LLHFVKIINGLLFLRVSIDVPRLFNRRACEILPRSDQILDRITLPAQRSGILIDPPQEEMLCGCFQDAKNSSVIPDGIKYRLVFDHIAACLKRSVRGEA
jgi:hypothetical protein